MLDRSNGEQVRFGETLPPETRIQLEELKVWDEFQRAGHIASPGNVSVWGNDVPNANDFILNPYGCGWHIERRRFDEMLVQNAKTLSVDVCRSINVISVARESAERWKIKAVDEERCHEFTARYLIDASGRSGLLARHLGIRKSVYDRLIAAITFLQVPPDSESCDTRTLIEATEFGWWYSALLPNSRLVVAFMTDADLLQHDLPLASQCRKHLENAPLTFTRVASCIPRFDIHLISAASYSLHNVVGEGWAAVGEAAMGFDPLSSSGIICGLESGIRVAELAESGGSDKVTNDRYDSWVKETVADFLVNRKRYYQAERRWPDSSFWYKRVVSFAASTS